MSSYVYDSLEICIMKLTLFLCVSTYMYPLEISVLFSERDIVSDYGVIFTMAELQRQTQMIEKNACKVELTHKYGWFLFQVS